MAREPVKLGSTLTAKLSLVDAYGNDRPISKIKTIRWGASDPEAVRITPSADSLSAGIEMVGEGPVDIFVSFESDEGEPIFATITVEDATEPLLPDPSCPSLSILKWLEDEEIFYVSKRPDGYFYFTEAAENCNSLALTGEQILTLCKELQELVGGK